jgi:HEAT repeat protein
MACESGAAGAPVVRAIESLLSAGRLGVVLDVIQGAPRDSPATELIKSRAVNPDTLKLLLSAQPVDFALVDQLLRPLAEDAVAPLLDVLAESESRQVRRAIIDRLLRMADAMSGSLAARLSDERWYVVRNILYLSAELPESPPGLDVTPFRQHPDARVRREAMRLLFRHPDERTRAICTALSDEDERMKRLALSAASEGGCPEPAVPLIVTIASDDELGSELRVAAVRALATHGGRLALDALLKLTEIRRRSLLDTMKGASATPEFLAALGALGGFLSDRRARERLEAATRNRDPGVVKTATQALKGVA